MLKAYKTKVNVEYQSIYMYATRNGITEKTIRYEPIYIGDLCEYGYTAGGLIVPCEFNAVCLGEQTGYYSCIGGDTICNNHHYTDYRVMTYNLMQFVKGMGGDATPTFFAMIQFAPQRTRYFK